MLFEGRFRDEYASVNARQGQSFLHTCHPTQFLETIEFYGKDVAASGYSDYDGNLVGDENDDENDVEGEEEVDKLRGSGGTAVSGSFLTFYCT